MSRLTDEIARRYYATTASRGHRPSIDYYEDAADRLMRRLRGWLPSGPSDRCVDLACGCGEMLYLLRRLGFKNLSGVDTSEDELGHARRHVECEFVVSDAADYLRQCRAESIDFISALNFLEHLSRDALLQVLHEARRVLRPGGVVVAMVPNALSPFSGITRYWDLTHEWSFSPNNFRQLAQLTGFSPDVQFRECGPVAHGLVSGLRWLMWQAVRLGIAGRLLIEIGTARGFVYTMDMLVRLSVPERADEASA